jgi:hypothetical protein
MVSPIWFSKRITYDLTGDVDGLVENDPSDRLPTSGVGRGSVVGHIEISLWEQTVERNGFDDSRLVCKRERERV